MHHAAFRTGGLSTVQTSVLYPAMGLIVLAALVVILKADTLELLALGDETAFSLGIPVKKARLLFLLSLVWGALAMLVCDTIARTAFAPFELSVGIVLSIVGAPVFIRMLLKKSR